jgi:hypothetical protein
MATARPTGISRLRDEAVALAGTTRDLVQRAGVYHHLYSDSGGNHCFPLLAAHGALWAGGYFRTGLRFGRLVANAEALAGFDRRARLASLDAFAEKFRDINRRVCIETFFIYRLTAVPAWRAHAEEIVPTGLLAAMDMCHRAGRDGRRLDRDQRRHLFTCFFLWEQETIVAPAVREAFASFDWALIRKLALRPTIRFAYLGRDHLAFRDFSDTAERIRMGLLAFDRAERAGWKRVEVSLSDYGIMPPAFATDPAGFFASIARGVFPSGRVAEA